MSGSLLVQVASAGHFLDGTIGIVANGLVLLRKPRGEGYKVRGYHQTLQRSLGDRGLHGVGQAVKHCRNGRYAWGY